MKITRRRVQLALGVLWLLDGILQLQPAMFSGFFAHSILAPQAQGQPSLVAGSVHLAVSLVSAQPVLSNGAFALIQIALGLGILSRRFSRVALGASIVWALSVWFVGEGIGGLATGATLLVGAPGAALLYAVIALSAWPHRDAREDERPSWLAVPAWSALWLTGAVLQLVNGNDSASSFTMMLKSSESSSPGWIAHLDRSLARVHLPWWVASAMVALDVLVAIWVVVPGWTRPLSLGIGVVIALASWLLFQGLGDLTSGQATDPNCGPLIVLLAVVVVGATRPRDVQQVPRDEGRGAASLVISRQGGVAAVM